MELDPLLLQAIAADASDVLFNPGAPPSIRVNGVLSAMGTEPLADGPVRGWLEQWLDEPARESLKKDKTHDFALNRHGRRFRASAYTVGGSLGLALRLLPEVIPTPEKLGLPSSVTALVRRPGGLLVVSGATGQGKSTSQASLIDLLNRTQPCHVVTLEDPIEFVHHSQKAVIDQRELGRDFNDFAGALKHVVRQRPDVVLVGELREPDAMQAALTLAETGHLVIATLHSGDAVLSLPRIVESFEQGRQGLVRAQLAAVLLGVLNQRLLHGNSGRLVLAAEVLVNTPAVARLIRDGHFEQLYSAMEMDAPAGHQTMNHAIAGLVARHAVAKAEGQRHSMFRESLPSRAAEARG
ncbi:MAG: PilT/PilU family type 4a pilus ATPase [Myxococcaceae bacterium]|nr:PilT/PilU family type 4a pilus ATPase [Myxococcaceae bacterium]